MMPRRRHGPLEPVFPRLHANLPLVLYWPVCWIIVIPWGVALMLQHILIPPKYRKDRGL